MPRAKGRRGDRGLLRPDVLADAQHRVPRGTGTPRVQTGMLRTTIESVEGSTR